MISVVMVTGGSTASAQSTSVELLASNGTRLCSLQNLPEARKHHSQSLNIICGGEGGESSCVTFFGDGSWYKTHTLATARSGHISWALPNGGLVLMGHHYQPQATTASVLTENGDSTLPGTLPYQI